MQVPVAAKVHVRLEALAARRLPRLDVTTSAFGMFDTGQIAQLPFYDTYARRLHPKLLVLVFFHNDFWNNSSVLTALRRGLDPDRLRRAGRRAAGGDCGPPGGARGGCAVPGVRAGGGAHGIRPGSVQGARGPRRRRAGAPDDAQLGETGGPRLRPAPQPGRGARHPPHQSIRLDRTPGRRRARRTGARPATSGRRKPCSNIWHRIRWSVTGLYSMFPAKRESLDLIHQR